MTESSRLSRLSFWHVVLIACILAAADFWVFDWAQWADRRGGDFLTRSHAERRGISPSVVVVDIDQKSLENMAPEVGRWPWPRMVHAALVESILAQKPKAVIFDLFFNEPDLDRPDSDQALTELLKNHPNVYVPTVFVADGTGPLSNTELPGGLRLVKGPLANEQARAPLQLPGAISDRSVWRGGLVNFEKDSDGVGRRYLLRVAHEGWLIPSMPSVLAQDMHWSVPDADSVMLNWRSGIRHVSYGDIYADMQLEKPVRAQNEFTDKVVIIGSAANGLNDLRLTPLSDIYPGVDILATAIDNLAQGDGLFLLKRSWAFLFLLPLTVFIGAAFARGWSILRVAAILLLASALMIAIEWIALAYLWQVSLVWSVLLWSWLAFLGASLLAYLKEREKRESAVRMFNRFLDPRVVETLVDSGQIDSGANAQSREVTVLFSDIRGFTSLSESRSPEEVVALLNRYFSMQVEVIFRHGGTLDKFIGDAIMAFWGAPVSDPDHARKAVAAALDMSKALEQFKRELGGNLAFDIGIGLNSGKAVVGFIGSNERLDYTAIGDVVNLASRIEGETKGVARVLVSDATRQLCETAFAFEPKGLHHVKGREQGVNLYEPKELNG